jgi:hypothetical protein
MAMALRVLEGEKRKLMQIIENMRAGSEKEGAIEGFVAAALSGYASQPRAASDVFYEKDHATGVLTPKPGGPVWVAEQSLKTMKCILFELEGMVESNAPKQNNQRAGEISEVPDSPDPAA